VPRWPQQKCGGPSLGVAEAAAREGKDVKAYVSEIIRVQLREAERVHELMSALDDIAGPGQN
jgi:hypothetical protein